MASSQIYNQMQGLLSRYNSYNPLSQDEAYRSFVQKANAFRPQYDEAANAEAQAYAAPAQMMSDYIAQGQNQPGVGASAAQKLASMMGTLGRYYGRANSVNGSIDAQKARLEDLAKTAVGDYGMQQDNVYKQYSGLLPLYQAQLDAEQQAANRSNQLKMNAFNPIAPHTNNGYWYAATAPKMSAQPLVNSIREVGRNVTTLPGIANYMGNSLFGSNPLTKGIWSTASNYLSKFYK